VTRLEKARAATTFFTLALLLIVLLVIAGIATASSPRYVTVIVPTEALPQALVNEEHAGRAPRYVVPVSLACEAGGKRCSVTHVEIVSLASTD